MISYLYIGGMMMNYKTLVNNQRLFFQDNHTMTYQFRREALLKLKQSIIDYEDQILEALHLDLGKTRFEGYLTEIGVTLLELNHTLKHLKKWMKRKRVKSPLALFKASSYLYQEPYGVTLIMSPWNYPFQLAIAPLIGAIAAGNTSVIKASPDASFTAKLIKKMMEEIFEPSFVNVFIGGLEESKAVLAQRYDYIFFTGSTEVGKIVMSQASQNLTPVTLELGGKSPAIIDMSVDLDLTAKRIIYGKFVNAGQTCIAPDYILIHKERKDELIPYLKKWIHTFFTESPITSKDYPKIINPKQHERLVKLLDDGTVVVGGRYDKEKIEPTIIINVDETSHLSTQEIFGPLLPIYTYDTYDTLIKTLKQKEKPLALYLFTNDKKLEKQLIKELSFGGATINDTLMHFANHNLPFGGVGHSGMGSYHGVHSFKTFSHEKGVVKRSRWIDLPIRYPKYTEGKLKIVKKIIK